MSVALEMYVFWTVVVLLVGASAYRMPGEAWSAIYRLVASSIEEKADSNGSGPRTSQFRVIVLLFAIVTARHLVEFWTVDPRWSVLLVLAILVALPLRDLLRHVPAAEILAAITSWATTKAAGGGSR